MTLPSVFIAVAHDTEPHLLIGQVAQLTGASCKAIRHYEAIGLLPRPPRRGRYRVYSSQDVFLVHMLQFGQQFGFTLQELRAVTAAKVSEGSFPLAMAQQLCRTKQAAVRAEIAALEARAVQLDALHDEMARLFTA